MNSNKNSNKKSLSSDSELSNYEIAFDERKNKTQKETSYEADKSKRIDMLKSELKLKMLQKVFDMLFRKKPKRNCSSHKRFREHPQISKGIDIL